jgi:hypothetical protein
VSGTLLHANYKATAGYELIKRPGLDAFLKKLAELGEVIIYSNEDAYV